MFGGGKSPKGKPDDGRSYGKEKSDEGKSEPMDLQARARTKAAKALVQALGLDPSEVDVAAVGKALRQYMDACEPDGDEESADEHDENDE